MAKHDVEFDYFHGYESEQFAFYRIPKVLFTDDYFKDLSSDAKILYGLMLDRMSLSIKNNWIDEEDRVYIIFTLEQVMQYMNFESEDPSREGHHVGLWNIKRTMEVLYQKTELITLSKAILFTFVISFALDLLAAYRESMIFSSSKPVKEAKASV